MAQASTDRQTIERLLRAISTEAANNRRLRSEIRRITEELRESVRETDEIRLQAAAQLCAKPRKP